MANRGVSRLAPAVGAALAAGLLVAPPGQADLADVDLRAEFDIRISGGGAVPDRLVASAGDVNGDGFDDMLVGDPNGAYSGPGLLGVWYVVFGGATGQVDLADLGGRGFRIEGTARDMGSGWTADGVGDVDGDGYDDLVIGSESATYNSRFRSGAAYVVLGGAEPGHINLADPGDRVFRLDGAATAVGLGWSVAGAGDVDGDGYDDLLLGAPRAENNDRDYSGSAYVVFGGSTEPLDLAALGDRGFRIDGAATGEGLGVAVAGAGDINADGVDDLLLGAPAADHGGVESSGSAYVVWGGPTDDVDLAALGDRGLRIDGTQRYGGLGGSVAGAGDVNADGIDDLLLGARGEDHNGRNSSGAAYVVFGGSSEPVNLAALGTRGFRIEGPARNASVGGALTSAGDVDADGFADLLLSGSRSAYVVFGGSHRTLDLQDPGNRAMRIKRGVSAIAGPGDINRDGYSDLLLVAGRRAFGVLGRPSAALSVKARRKTRKVNATARTKLVRRISVGTGQTARVTVEVLPKKARKTVEVKKTRKRVVVRTRNTPRKTRIRVRITSRAPDHFTRTWTRTWRVR